MTALGVGTLLVFTDVGKPLLPSLPVFLYAALLVVAQSKYFIRLSNTIKDSPYFLGFILTLVGLVGIFRSLGFDLEAAAQDAGFLAREVGGALLTTVVGLVARQVLLSLDSFENRADREFQLLHDEVRKRSDELAAAQRNLVAMVSELTEHRAKYLEAEDKIAEVWLKRITSGAEMLGKLEESLPPRISALVEQCEKAGERVSASARRSARRTSRAARATAGALESLAAAAPKTRAALELEVSAAADLATTSVAQARERASELRDVTGSYAKLADGLTESLTGLKTNATQASSELSTATKALKEVSEKVGTIPRTLDSAISGIRQSADETGREVGREIHDRAYSLLKEVRDIDAVIGELITLLQGRLRAFGALSPVLQDNGAPTPTADRLMAAPVVPRGDASKTK